MPRSPSIEASHGNGIAPWEKAARLDWLQTLRAASVLLVMLHHLVSATDVYFNEKGIIDFFYFGHCGVDIFFVISGFIMWHIYRADLHRPDRFTPFLKRRFLRIYPVYWILTTGLLLVILWVPGEVKDYKRNVFYIIETYALIPLGFAQGNPIIPAAWSLFHEIKFYLLFSLCILLPPRASRWWARILVILTLLHMAWLVTPDGQAAGMGFLFSPFNLEFLAGCLVAHFVQNREPKGWVACLATVVGVTGIAVLGHLDSLRAMEDRLVRVLAYGGPSVALVLAATTLDHLPAWRHRTSRLMVLLGDASYAIYLIHYPIYCMAALAIIKLGLAAKLPLAVVLTVFFAAALIIALLFHVFVERPLTDKLKRWLA